MLRDKLKLLFLLIFGLELSQAGNMVCYYDSESFQRTGLGQLPIADLEPALQFCNYLVYGYAGIDPLTYKLSELNYNLDVRAGHYKAITQLKQKYPQLRVLLSVGGDRDSIEPQYLLLLEDAQRRQNFVNSAVSTLSIYGFDGLDLAWQFPKNFPKEVKSGLRRAWSTFKGWFTSAKVVDEHAEEHKAGFTALVRELRTAFGYSGTMLTLTMLPNVDTSLFIDVFTVSANIDFVNLATFDFVTPERDPQIADHTAPLYAMIDRDPAHNINAQVEYWLNHTASANIINIGIASYGRAWVMTADSGITGFPPIPYAGGPAPGGSQLNKTGILSWPEICENLSHIGNNARMVPLKQTEDEGEQPLRMVGDPTKRFGIYAYRAANDSGMNGLWVSYDNPTIAAIKAGYVRAKGLAGVALFDLSMDDFRGVCAGEKYPILRSIKYKL